MILKLALLACTALALPLAAHAQAYPSKPIRNVMTFGLGGGGDIIARLVGQKLHEAMGQPVVVDPQGAAGGAVGADIVARAAPDGYTILFGSSSTMVLRKFLVKNTGYDVIRDFTPLMMLGETMSCVVAAPALPVNSLAEAIEYAKRNPGKISYGSSGIGTSHHLAGETVQILTGTKMVHVPYKTGQQAGSDAVGGQIQLVFNIVGAMQPFIGPGKLKYLAVISNKRYPQLPQVPAITEVLPGFERPPSWTAYFAPAGLPQPIAKRLSDELLKAVNSPEVVPKAMGLGFLVDTLGPVEFAANIRQSVELSARIIKAAGIEAE